MAQSWRSMWQQWKKQNPGFDAVRVKTLDVGPLMDDMQHEMAAMVRDIEKSRRLFADLEKTKRSLDAGLKRYSADVTAVIDSMVPSTQQIPSGYSVPTATETAERKRLRAAYDQKMPELRRLINTEGLWRGAGGDKDAKAPTKMRPAWQAFKQATAPDQVIDSKTNLGNVFDAIYAQLVVITKHYNMMAQRSRELDQKLKRLGVEIKKNLDAVRKVSAAEATKADAFWAQLQNSVRAEMSKVLVYESIGDNFDVSRLG